MTDIPQDSPGSLGSEAAPLDLLDPAAQSGESHLDPFAGDSLAVTTSQDVDVVQLAAEINAAVGTTMQVVVSMPQSDSPDRSEAMVYVSPSQVDGVSDLQAIIDQVVADHTPVVPTDVTPEGGLTDRVDLLDPGFVEKLTTGAKVTTAELASALRSILGITPQVDDQS